jgi:hypothetical protein
MIPTWWPRATTAPTVARHDTTQLQPTVAPKRTASDRLATRVEPGASCADTAREHARTQNSATAPPTANMVAPTGPKSASAAW